MPAVGQLKGVVHMPEFCHGITLHAQASTDMAVIKFLFPLSDHSLRHFLEIAEHCPQSAARRRVARSRRDKAFKKNKKRGGPIEI